MTTPIETVQALVDALFDYAPLGWKYDALTAGRALVAQMSAQETAASRATPDAEFELHCNGEPQASAFGPRAQAWREIQHYAAQYAQDGPVEIYEIKRVLVTGP